MCEYCKEKKCIISKEINEGTEFFTETVVYEIEYAVFVDRGYLRLVDKDDCQCLDHGEKFKINFCPMCGESVEII